MTSCPGISRYIVRYVVRRGRAKGKRRAYIYYKARIGVMGRTIFLGNYTSKREAVAVRQAMLVKLERGDIHLSTIAG